MSGQTDAGAGIRGAGGAGREFMRRFLAHLLACCYRREKVVWDAERFGAQGRREKFRDALRQAMFAALNRLGLSRPAFDMEKASGVLADIIALSDGLSRTYSLLADEYSRAVLIDVLAFKVLGPLHVRLPRCTDEYWARRDAMERTVTKENSLVTATGRILNEYEVRVGQHAVRFHTSRGNVFYTFDLGTHSYRQEDVVIGPKRGDLIIDGGACWGDTALLFAAIGGEAGRVFSFEFAPDNLRVMKDNLSLNPSLSERIVVVERALHETGCATLTGMYSGPGSRVVDPGEGAGHGQVQTASIDGFAADNGLARVDYIKLDIEGCELQALKGGVRILRRDRPRLAISVYHRRDDLAAIPCFLDDLGLGYAFYLDHFTTFGEETMLFAAPEGA